MEREREDSIFCRTPVTRDGLALPVNEASISSYITDTLEGLWLFIVNLKTPKLSIIQIVSLEVIFKSDWRSPRGPWPRRSSPGKETMSYRWWDGKPLGSFGSSMPRGSDSLHVLLANSYLTLLAVSNPIGLLPCLGHISLPVYLAAVYAYLHFSNYNICLPDYLSSRLFEGKDSISFISCIPCSWPILCTKKDFVLRLTHTWAWNV